MDLLTATRRVKNALSSKDYISALTHYHLKSGRVYATDGSLTASAPIDESLEYVVPAEEFNKALEIFGSDATYTWSSESLVIKKGKKRMTIRLLPPDVVSLQEPVKEKYFLSDSFLDSVKKIRPFISDDASRPWALTAWLRSNELGAPIFLATNNITVVAVEIKSLTVAQLSIDVQIPNFALDFLLGREQKVIAMGATENKVSFFFDDDSQVTSQLFALKMPDQVYSILSSVEPTDSAIYFELTDEWKEAYKSIVSISPEEIMLGPSIMSAGRKQAQMEIDMGTVTPRDISKQASYYNPKFLTPVVDIATHIDFANYPGTAGFFGEGVRGLISGKVV